MGALREVFAGGVRTDDYHADYLLPTGGDGDAEPPDDGKAAEQPIEAAVPVEKPKKAKKARKAPPA